MSTAQVHGAEQINNTQIHLPLPETKTKTKEHHNPPRRPKHIKYIPVPGEWQRATHPHWPESTFHIPEKIPFGTIYYYTKGDFVGTGSTARVERLPSGHISKTPLTNPYDPWTEQQNRESLAREHKVYCLIGPCRHVPNLIDWDEKARTLILEDLVEGDLKAYIKKHRDIDMQVREQWMLQAAQALESLHAVGITHQDVTPRNYLLSSALDLRLSDFGTSSFPGYTCYAGAPGPRYQSTVWKRGYAPTRADDIFSLGSVLYFIMAGEEPYQDLEDEEVEDRFAASSFPTTVHLRHGSVITQCWNGGFSSVGQVASALMGAGWRVSSLPQGEQ